MSYQPIRPYYGFFIILVTFGTTILFQPLALYTQLLAPKTVFLTALYLQNLLLISLVLYFLYQRHHMQLTDIGFQMPQRRGGIARGALYGIGILTLMMLIIALMNELIPQGLPAQNVESIFSADDSQNRMLLAAGAVSILAPIAEELFFRGYMFAAFQTRFGPYQSMILTSVFFGVMHFDIYRFLPLALGGFFLNLIRYKENSLIPAMVAHGVWNFIMLLMMYMQLKGGFNI